MRFIIIHLPILHPSPSLNLLLNPLSPSMIPPLPPVSSNDCFVSLIGVSSVLGSSVSWLPDPFCLGNCDNAIPANPPPTPNHTFPE